MLSVLVRLPQFVVMSAGLLVVTVLVLARVGWTNLVVAVERYHGAEGFNPLVNPNGVGVRAFNACLNLAVVLTWMA